MGCAPMASFSADSQAGRFKTWSSFATLFVPMGAASFRISARARGEGLVKHNIKL